MGQRVRPVTAVVTLKITLLYLLISVASVLVAGVLMSLMLAPGMPRQWGWIVAGCLYAGGTTLWVSGLVRRAYAVPQADAQRERIDQTKDVATAVSTLPLKV